MIAQDMARNIKKSLSTTRTFRPPAERHLIRRRAMECLAMTMIGDGALGFVEPVGHVNLWLRGPKFWRKMLRPFAERPELTRWVGAAEFGFGVWLALRQQRET